MSSNTLGLFLRHLALSEEVGRLGSASDGHLLAAYEAERGEAAFTELVRRHGPMVLRTCRRVLGPGPDADDAFQATFVLLARKAGRLHREAAGPLSLGGWLHRVAYQTALNVMSQLRRRRTRERQAGAMPPPDRNPVTQATWNEVKPILDAELNALPDEPRRLLIACYLQGKTHAEAAAELGLPLGSLARRLEKARALLAGRLARRGITVSAVVLATLLADPEVEAGLPAVLLVHTVEAAATFSGQSAGVMAGRVARLVNAGLANTAKGPSYLSLFLAGLMGILGVGWIATRALQTPPTATPDRERPPAEAAAHVDRLGDPLPPGALARLGTIRLRSAAGGQRSVLFTAGGRGVITSGRGNPTRLWEVATGKLVRQFGDAHTQAHAVALSPDGRVLAGRGGPNGGLRLWDVATGKRLAEGKGGPADVVCLTFSPDGKAVAGAGLDNKLRLWDAATGHERWVKDCFSGAKQAIAFTPDGKRLAVVESKGLFLWDVDSGVKCARGWAPGRRIVSAAFAPDGRTLAVACDPPPDSRTKDIVVRLVDTDSLEERRQLAPEKAGQGAADPFQALALAPGGKILATANGSGAVRLWDTDTGKEPRRCQGDPCFPNALAFSADGRILAGADRGLLRLWDTDSAKERSPVRGGHKQLVSAVGFTPDGALVSSSWDGSVREWDAATGEERRQFVPAGEQLGGRHLGGFGTAISLDGRIIAAVHLAFPIRRESFGLVARRWDRDTARERGRFLVDLGETLPGALALSPDTRMVACTPSADAPDEVHLLELATGKLTSRVRGNLPTFSADGKRLATVRGGQNDPAVLLWEVATGKEIGSFPLPKGRPCYLLAFSPEGDQLATVSNVGTKHTIQLWPLRGESPGSGPSPRVGPPRDVAEVAAWVRALCFSPDGRALAVPDEGGTVRVFETATGAERRCFTGHAGEVWSLAFSRDGRRLASGGIDTTILVWDVTGRLEGGRLRPAQLSAREREDLWAELAAADTGKAGMAVWKLAATPAQAVPLLAAKLSPAAPLTPETAAKLVRDLDDAAYAVRVRAREELEKYGAVAESTLKKARAKAKSAEVRRTLDDLLAAAAARRQRPSGEALRCLRAVEVLEQIGTPEARQVLREWAAGTPAAVLTRQARAALDRSVRP